MTLLVIISCKNNIIRISYFQSNFLVNNQLTFIYTSKVHLEYSI